MAAVVASKVKRNRSSRARLDSGLEGHDAGDNHPALSAKAVEAEKKRQARVLNDKARNTRNIEYYKKVKFIKCHVSDCNPLLRLKF